ncbi:MAG: hypothetical protein SFZ03_11315 [Candidatus Melainabacteria bacterium]|nr:hypothetical protein [Candidatus Melainabacteria bacterium]
MTILVNDGSPIYPSENFFLAGAPFPSWAFTPAMQFLGIPQMAANFRDTFNNFWLAMNPVYAWGPRLTPTPLGGVEAVGLSTNPDVNHALMEAGVIVNQYLPETGAQFAEMG